MSANYEKAELLLQLRRPADAEKAVREALAAAPNDAHLHCLLSHALQMQQGRTKAAVAAAQRGIGLAPDWAFTHNTLGWALLARGNPVDAAAAFGEAVRLDPDNAEYYYGQAEALRVGRRMSQARRVAEQGIAIDPRHVGCRNNWAACTAGLGAAVAATRHLEDTLAIDPRNVTTHTLLGWVWLARSRPLRAVRYYLTALQLDPTDRDNRSVLRFLVSRISHLLCWASFTLLTLVVGWVANEVVKNTRSNTADRPVGVAIAMLVVLGFLLFRRRFRETLAMLPFRFGRSLHTAEDRKYVASTLIVYAVTAGVSMAVALLAPPAPSAEFVPCFAACTFPLAPWVIWLDWRQARPLVAALGVAVLGLAQIAVGVAVCLVTPGPDFGPISTAALCLTVIALFLIPSANELDK